MTEDMKVGRLERAIISGVGHKGLSVTTADGKPASLAVIDEAGQIIESGPEVAIEAFAVSINVHRNIWAGNGWLTVHTEPPRMGSTGTGSVGKRSAA